MHVDLGRGVFSHPPRNLFDEDSALRAIDPSHAIHQKDQIAPEGDELKPPRRARLVVAGRGLMTPRANGSGSFPRTDRDEDGSFVVDENGPLVDKSRDGMAMIQNSGKAHAWTRGRYEDEDESPFSPSGARRAVALLPRSSGVAGALDGRGKGSSAR